jgi:hypothetical protein
MEKKNQIQKINKENNQLFLEMESKLDLLRKEVPSLANHSHGNR